MDQLLILFMGLPLAAFFLSLFWKNRNERPLASIVWITKIAYIIQAVSFAVWWAINGLQPVTYKLATLYQTDHFVFALQFYYDEITAVFSIVGALLFFLVATFSRYYMHRDQGYKRFFNTILLFAAGYNFIILAGNFETLFIGWEVKGLCSFLLIAFYRERYLPVKNAYKAVSNYRLSDVSLMLAMWMMHHLTQQNVSFTQLADAKSIAVSTGQYSMAVFIVCMLILPAVIKSAQFPFSSWLPRAMEGPTSSSAIFYGSLSVHIGVFLLLRTHSFWEDMLWAKVTIIVIGVLTAVISTLIARVQPTVKTQIAYSSTAQIGLMFIEIALGFHWLVLVHFAGNAFLRTYQLLVSPSVLNYLVHHQYFHYHPPKEKPVSKLKATLYVLDIKEWNLDTMMFKYVWTPFKQLGNIFGSFGKLPVKLLILALAILAASTSIMQVELFENASAFLPIVFMSIALMIILSSFSSGRSAAGAWDNLLSAHLFILSAVVVNADHVNTAELIMYAGGILLAYVTGVFCLRRIHMIDKDIDLNKYHGYVYEQKTTSLLFLLSAIGMLGFPITAAFIGIDVLFTYVHSGQAALIILLALCFIFIELAALRIYCRIFLGPHKKLYHQVAFRSS